MLSFTSHTDNQVLQCVADCKMEHDLIFKGCVCVCAG
jgi:hypothetical protein